jgi:magnesium-transporting ATPase (P-type)
LQSLLPERVDREWILGDELTIVTRIGWVEGAAILVAVFIVAMVSAVNDYSKDKKFRQLTAIADNRNIKVMRNGSPIVISTFDVSLEFFAINDNSGGCWGCGFA